MNSEMTSPKQSRSIGELMEIIDQVTFWEVVELTAPSDNDSGSSNASDHSGETVVCN
jgi:hypothetical protein